MVDEIAHVVDLGGDVVLVLRNPNAPFAVWKDSNWVPPPKLSKKEKKKKKRYPELIDEPIPEAPVEESVPEPAEEPMPEPAIHEIERPSIGFGSVEGPQPAQNTQSDEESEVKFLLSSRHLILASRYFNAKLKGDWKEATPHAIDRRYHLEASDWDPDALLILMNVIHGRTRSVPRHVDCEMLAKIAVLVDYYDCHEAIEVFASMWIDALKDQLTSECSRDLVLWLLIAHVFQQHDIFAKVTKTAVLEGCGPMPTMDLPIPPIVADLIEWRRQDAVGFVLNALNDLRETLRKGEDDATICMNLGALDKAMYKAELLGLSEPYLGHGVADLEKVVRSFRAPSFGSRGSYYYDHSYHSGDALSKMIDSRLNSEFAKNKEGFTLAEVAMSDVSRREGKDKDDVDDEVD